MEGERLSSALKGVSRRKVTDMTRKVDSVIRRMDIGGIRKGQMWKGRLQREKEK